MANATVAYTINNSVPLGNKNQKSIEYHGTLAFSAAGGNYTAGGLPATANKALANLGPYSNRTPISWYAWSTVGSGFQYEYLPATGKLMILAGGGNGVAAPIEVTDTTQLNATTPQIATDVVNFKVEFPMGSV